MHSDDVTYDQVFQIARNPLNQLLQVILSVGEAYDDLEEMRNSRTAQAWARDLRGLQNTGLTQLDIDATGKTVKCRPGFALFSAVNVNRDVVLSGFTNAGNNQTTLITGRPDNDTLTIADASGLVTETGGGDERAIVNATTEERDKLQDLIDGYTAAKEVIDAARNVAVTTAERRNLMRRVS